MIEVEQSYLFRLVYYIRSSGSIKPSASESQWNHFEKWYNWLYHFVQNDFALLSYYKKAAIQFVEAIQYAR